MCEIKLLQNVADNLHNLANSISDIVNEMLSQTETKQEIEKTNTPTETLPPKNEVDVEDVRAVLAEKSKDGKTNEAKALLLKYGARQVSKVKQEDLGALLKEAEVL